jgi:hypothetical protein
MSLRLYLQPFLTRPLPPPRRRTLLVEGLEDRTVPAHGMNHHGAALLHGHGHHHHHHHPAVVTPTPGTMTGSDQGREAGENENDNDNENEHCTPVLTETVTADFTATSTLQLAAKDAFTVVNGKLMATGTLAGQDVTVPVTFTAATGTTAPTISLALPDTKVTVGGQQFTLKATDLLLSGPNAPTTDLGTAIANDAATLNALTNLNDIANTLSGLVTPANSTLSDGTVTGSVTGPLTINGLSAGPDKQVLASGTFLGQKFSNVPVQLTGTGMDAALTLGPLSLTQSGLMTTFDKITVPLKPMAGATGNHLDQRLATLQVLFGNSSAAQAKINALDRVFEALGATCSGEGED